MYPRRLIPRLSRPPGRQAYLLALGLAAAATAGKALLNHVVPSHAVFNLLFPTLVVAGAFLGTGPAILTAVTGGAAAMALFLGSALLQWPPANGAQIDALMLLPTSAAIIWATRALHGSVTRADAAQARLREVFRQIPAAAAILEAPTGRLLMRSARSDAILGPRNRDAATGDTLGINGGLHQDGRPYAADEYPIARALTTGEIIQGEPLLYRRADGTLVHLEIYAAPVLDPESRIVAAVGMAFDVSARLAAEARLRESEGAQAAIAKQLRTAIEAAALGVWEVNADTDHIKIDARFAALLDLPAEPTEMHRAEIRRFIAPAQQHAAATALSDAIARGETYTDELHMISASGHHRWLTSHGAVLRDTNKVVGVVSDVTGRRQREHALAAALRAQEVLMHEADHRIKNSLQLVTSLLGLQRNRIADPDAQQALEAAISRVEAIANAHLALQRSPDLRSIEVDRMLQDLCGQMRTLNPTITLHCETESTVTLDADRAIPLGLIATELLTNALRHAYPSGAEGTVTLSTTLIEERLELAVIDHGAGLPAPPARRGLGTTLIAALLRQIDAQAETTSSPDRGTAIRIRLNRPALATTAI